MTTTHFDSPEHHVQEAPPRRRATWTNLGIVALLLVSGALGTPLATMGIPTRGSLLDLGAVVAGGLALTIGGWRWWRRLPLPFLLLGAIQLALSIITLAWATDRSQAVQATAATVVGIALAVLGVGAVATLRRGWRALSWWGVLLVVPSLLLWSYVPGFAPEVLTTTPHPSGTMGSYFARLSHPFYGPSNNLAALLIPLVIPLMYLATRARKRALIPFLVVVIAVTGTLSRGALLSLAVAVALWLLLARGVRGRTLILAVPALIVATAAAWFVLYPHPSIDRHLTRTYLPATVAHTYADRRATTTYAGEGDVLSTTVSSDALVRGRGAGSPDGIDNGRIPLLEQGLKEVTIRGKGAGYELHVHNTYLQQLIDFGYVGGAISILAMLTMLGWWFRRGLRGGRDLAALAVGCGIAAQLMSFVLESSYEGDLLRRAIWLEWGLLAGFYLSLTRREHVEEGQASTMKGRTFSSPNDRY